MASAGYTVGSNPFRVKPNTIKLKLCASMLSTRAALKNMSKYCLAALNENNVCE